MVAGPASVPGPASLARRAGWTYTVAADALVIAGLATAVGHAPARALLGTAVALAASAPLFVLRSRPTAVFAVMASAGVVLLGTGDPSAIVWFALVIFASWCVLAGGVPLGLAYWGAALALLGAEWTYHHDPGWAPWAGGLTLSVLATVLVRHEFVLIEKLRAAQADLASQSRAEERARIARELHDVIAHSLTVSLLHVTSARLAVEHDPANAGQALAEAERLGRQALAEVRATMGIMSDSNGVAPPAPGFEQVPHLVNEYRQAGVDITLTTAGDQAGLPGAVGTTLYRIVQEAMTNAVKHAPGKQTWVDIVVEPHEVGLTVESAGPPGQGSGMGLANMAERAKAVGGTCSAGPGGRGWRVHAALPLPAEPGPWP